MPRRVFLLSVCAMALAFAQAGCDRQGIAQVRIINTQGFNQRANPVEIDPAVHVEKNEWRYSHGKGGMDVVQTIEIKGPIRIVPATQPH